MVSFGPRAGRVGVIRQPQELPPEAFWDPAWFPLFRFDRGEIAVTCSTAGAPATVHEVDWDQPEERPTLPSLAAFDTAATAELREHFVWLPTD